MSVSDGEVVRSGELEMTASVDGELRPNRQMRTVWIPTTVNFTVASIGLHHRRNKRSDKNKNIKKRGKKFKKVNVCEVVNVCQNLPSIQLLSSHTESCSLSNFNAYLNVTKSV